jgi:hypothetical protein
MGSSLSSLEEALQTLNSIKFGRDVRSCTNDATDMAAKASIEISNNFS